MVNYIEYVYVEHWSTYLLIIKLEADVCYIELLIQNQY